MKQSLLFATQINKIIASNNLLIAGTEDFKLRFVDLGSGKVVKTVIGHADAISCLT